jgi:hypothetical protein
MQGGSRTRDPGAIPATSILRQSSIRHLDGADREYAIPRLCPALAQESTLTETNSLLKQRLITWVGIGVLLFGLVSAGTVYWTGETRPGRPDREAAQSDSRDDTLSFEDSKTSSRGTEMYFGKIGVLFATWFHRWESLGDSERLAIMIAVASVLAASICFFVANRVITK